MPNLPQHTTSSGNVFADLGLPNAGEPLLKSQIVSEIADVMKSRKLTQSNTARLTAAAQPDISNLMRGLFKGFSVERLLLMLNNLGRDIEITVKPVPRSRKVGGIEFRREAA